MNFLLSDKSIGKMRKLPKAIWYIILAMSFFAQSAYRIIQDANMFALQYSELAAANNITYNKTAFVIFVCIGTALLYMAFAQIIMRIVYNVLARRFVIASNADDFIFRATIVLILSNIIVGIVGVTYFFYAQVMDITMAIINFAVPTSLFILFYENFRIRFVPKKSHYKLMNYIAKIYLGIYTALSFFAFVVFIMDASIVKTSMAIAVYSVDLAIKLLFVLIAYLYGNKLKKISEQPEDNELFKVKEESKIDNVVFKDFDF